MTEDPMSPVKTGSASVLWGDAKAAVLNDLAAFQNQTPSENRVTAEPQRKARVLLVDDDPHVRRVITQELLADPRLEVVAQGASFHEGRRLIVNHEFDVLMVDLHLGDGSGLDLVKLAKTQSSLAEVIVISVFDDDDRVMQAFELGATGYLVKTGYFQNYAQSVLQVVNGGASITPGLARRLLQKFRAPVAPPSKVNAAPAGSPSMTVPLTQRESEVLRLVASGHTNCEVGATLAISVQTVNSHVKNIYRKMHVRTRAQAIDVATKARLFRSGECAAQSA